MKQAAQELTALVRDQILAKGGKTVVVFNLPDSALTPFGSTLPANARSVLTTLLDMNLKTAVDRFSPLDRPHGFWLLCPRPPSPPG